MIVQRLRSFPKKYKEKINKFSEYCDRMVMNGMEGTQLELQVIADICFSVVECYSTSNCFGPMKVIYPLRFPTVPKSPNCIRLWVLAGHCVALARPQTQPLIQNIFDDSELLQAISDSALEEASNDKEVNSEDKSC
jgi:hypothetical protein